jgi:L-aspartate oxidase
VAGLSAAIEAASVLGLRVGVLTKGELSQSATRWAQGGVAAALGGDADSADLHLADTLAAGAGLCDPDAVRVLVDEGPARVNDLIALGAVFDRDPTGVLALAREGGHSVARVVHAGGAATGAEIERALVEAVRATAVAVMERWFAAELVVRGGRCRGVVAVDPGGTRHEVLATHTLLACGGAGQLYSVTTNPAEVTGDGVAMALRAGAAVADLEFVQFHPTALHHPQMPTAPGGAGAPPRGGGRVGAQPGGKVAQPLLSEALRGHGALLRDGRGERFVDELLPRDVVSRAMAARMEQQGVDHLWLDATPLEAFDQRFPTIAAALRQVGLDPTTDWLPIAPAAHYFVGGVLTDLDGASSVPALWAAGEVACTGVHGANRLASNSLLEGMVFAARVVEAIARGVEGPSPSGLMAALDRAGHTVESRRTDPRAADPPDPVKAREELQRAMTRCAGLARDGASLASWSPPVPGTPVDADSGEMLELRNLATVGAALVAAATAREETRGCHTRTDFPARSPELGVHVLVGPG